MDRRARGGRIPSEGSQPSAVMRLGALPLPGLFLLHQGWPREGSHSWGPAPCMWPNLSPTAEVNLLPVQLLSLCSENVRPPLSFEGCSESLCYLSLGCCSLGEGKTEGTPATQTEQQWRVQGGPQRRGKNEEGTP